MSTRHVLHPLFNYSNPCGMHAVERDNGRLTKSSLSGTFRSQTPSSGRSQTPSSGRAGGRLLASAMDPLGSNGVREGVKSSVAARWAFQKKEKHDIDALFPPKRNSSTVDGEGVLRITGVTKKKQSVPYSYIRPTLSSDVESCFQESNLYKEQVAKIVHLQEEMAEMRDMYAEALKFMVELQQQDEILKERTEQKMQETMVYQQQYADMWRVKSQIVLQAVEARDVANASTDTIEALREALITDRTELKRLQLVDRNSIIEDLRMTAKRLREKWIDAKVQTSTALKGVGKIKAELRILQLENVTLRDEVKLLQNQLKTEVTDLKDANALLEKQNGYFVLESSTMKEKLNKKTEEAACSYLECVRLENSLAALEVAYKSYTKDLQDLKEATKGHNEMRVEHDLNIAYLKDAHVTIKEQQEVMEKLNRDLKYAQAEETACREHWSTSQESYNELFRDKYLISQQLDEKNKEMQEVKTKLELATRDPYALTEAQLQQIAAEIAAGRLLDVKKLLFETKEWKQMQGEMDARTKETKEMQKQVEQMQVEVQASSVAQGKAKKDLDAYKTFSHTALEQLKAEHQLETTKRETLHREAQEQIKFLRITLNRFNKNQEGGDSMQDSLMMIEKDWKVMHEQLVRKDIENEACIEAMTIKAKKQEAAIVDLQARLESAVELHRQSLAAEKKEEKSVERGTKNRLWGKLKKQFIEQENEKKISLGLPEQKNNSLMDRVRRASVTSLQGEVNEGILQRVRRSSVVTLDGQQGSFNTHENSRHGSRLHSRRSSVVKPADENIMDIVESPQHSPQKAAATPTSKQNEDGSLVHMYSAGGQHDEAIVEADEIEDDILDDDVVGAGVMTFDKLQKK